MMDFNSYYDILINLIFGFKCLLLFLHEELPLMCVFLLLVDLSLWGLR